MFETFVLSWLKVSTVDAVRKRLRPSWNAVDNIMEWAVRRGLARCHGTRFQGSLSELVGEHIGYIEPVHYSDNTRLAFIPRSELKVDETPLEQWINTAIHAGKIISLTDYLNNPGPFHVKPYFHEVNDILLRPYALATRSLS